MTTYLVMGLLAITVAVMVLFALANTKGKGKYIAGLAGIGFVLVGVAYFEKDRVAASMLELSVLLASIFLGVLVSKNVLDKSSTYVDDLFKDEGNPDPQAQNGEGQPQTKPSSDSTNEKYVDLLKKAAKLSIFAVPFLLIVNISMQLILPVVKADDNSVIEHLGTFGDFFGGTLNPVLTFATFIALIATILIQLKELRLTREELKNSNQQLKMSREEQAKTALALEEQGRTQRKQQFESTFFSLLGIINERSKENERILSSFFEIDWDNFHAGPHAWLKQRRKKLGRSDQEFIAQSTDYFFNILGLIQGLDHEEEEFFYSGILINSAGSLLITYVYVILNDIDNHSRLQRNVVLEEDYNFEAYRVFRGIDFSLISPCVMNYESFNKFIFLNGTRISILNKELKIADSPTMQKRRVIKDAIYWNDWLIDGVDFFGQKSFFGNFRVVEQYEGIRILNIKAKQILSEIQ